MADTSFEQKFGQLVDAQINEKIPSIVRHRIGFQVLDKTEDDTKAVGVAGFVIGNLWTYIPAFFLEGKIKGLDLLWIKQYDLFAPAVDNMISSIATHGESVFGTYRKQPTGTDVSEFKSPENTVIYNARNIFGKTAFDEGSIISAEDMSRMMRAYLDYRFPDLHTGIVGLGKTAACSFLKTFLHNPYFSNNFFKFYSVDEMQKLANDCAKLAMEGAVTRPESVSFITDIRSKEAQDLSDSEKNLLLRNGLYVRDNRTNFSKIFHEEIDSNVLRNPTEPGIYDVFLHDGSYKTAILLFPGGYLDAFCHSEAGFASEQPAKHVGKRVAMIDITRPTTYFVVPSNEIFCKVSTNITEENVKGLQGGNKASLQELIAAKVNHDSTSKTSVPVLFVQSPTRSIEVLLSPPSSDLNGSKVAQVFRIGPDDGNRMSAQSNASPLNVEFVGDYATLQIKGNTLFIPKGTRMFLAEDNNRINLSLGTPSTIYQAMNKTAGINTIEIKAQGETAEIKFMEASTGLITKEAAMRTLVERHGVFAGQAMQMIKDAAHSKNHSRKYLIKHAAAYNIAAYGNSRAPWMGGPAPVPDKPVTETLKTVGGQALSNDSMIQRAAIERAVSAAEAGVKEVFDVSVLSGLVDKADISELRKDYIVDMFKGMDRIGRLLFLFYWNEDNFRDRYGTGELQDLEDSMLNVFKSLGDLVLFLKEKTVFSSDTSEEMFGTLSENIATAG